MTLPADLSTSTLSQLRRYTGGLSAPGKMPGPGYSLPAEDCIVGSRLRGIVGSVCAGTNGRLQDGCYAMRNRYRMPVVKTAMQRRLAAITLPRWADAMTELIRRSGCDVFRWHDSGDLQSAEHLQRICQIADALPAVRFWLPTREYRIVNKYRRAGSIPQNLVIRLSAHMVDASPPAGDLPTSTVHTVDAPAGSHVCPAPQQGHRCGSCRACWEPAVRNVSYLIH